MSLRVQVKPNDTVAVDEIGGGGSPVELEALEVTQNGVYQQEGVAYTPVTVNVPRGYSWQNVPTKVISVRLTEEPGESGDGDYFIAIPDSIRVSVDTPFRIQVANAFIGYVFNTPNLTTAETIVGAGVSSIQDASTIAAFSGVTLKDSDPYEGAYWSEDPSHYYLIRTEAGVDTSVIRMYSLKEE